VAAQVEEVRDSGVHADESLRLNHRFEPSHPPLSYPGRLMRQLGPVVRVPTGVVRSSRQQLAVGYRVASQLVRHDRSRLMPEGREHSPEESSGRCRVSPLLEQYVDDLTVLVNGSP
jgi:hypothetical protein